MGRPAPCRKVRSYRDEISAKLALAVLRRQDKPGHHEQRAYRCHDPRHRGRWHLTKQPR